MAISSLVTTPGAANANAYCDVTFADQYHLDRPPDGNAWADADEADKTKAILWATKMLDRLVRWNGLRVTEAQALLWPRYGMYDSRGISILSTVIPIELKEATAEYARSLLADSRAIPPDAETTELEKLATVARREGLSSAQIHDNSITMRDTPFADRPIPDSVYYLLPSSWSVSRSVVELLRA